MKSWFRMAFGFGIAILIVSILEDKGAWVSLLGGGLIGLGTKGWED